ncbi:radical SAM protein [Methanopyrus sp. SNP6]|uniref:radical SAM protein n=1 Tax=Methanopyrus sp. SNP6 TaxID=1937005 RepID=UPI0011E5F649|nr:radical SAM protein [Methanopyrus sp. SNP6]
MRLRIAGLRPVSCSDGLPGEVCAVLWTQGCPLRCPWCHNPETRDPNGGKKADVKTILRDVEKYAVYLDALIVSGGEPLLQPYEELKALARGARDLGLNVVLDTSGFPPDRLGRVISSFDRVALDLKAPLHGDEYIEATGGGMTASDFLKAARIVRRRCDLELRITVHPWLDDVPKVVEAVRKASPDVVVVQRYVGDKEVEIDPEELAEKLRESCENVVVRV